MEKLNRWTQNFIQSKGFKEMMNEWAVEIDQNKVRYFAKEEGKIEGKIEGKEEGRKEGKIEGKVNVARLMLKANEPIEKIKEFTGLSEKEIKRLDIV